MVLTKPTDAAAADSPIVMVGNTQKDGDHAQSDNPVTHSQAMVAGNDWPGMVIIAKDKPAMIKGTAVCSFRSRRRSEDLAVSWTVRAAATNGIADSSVDCCVDRPECC